MNTVKGTISILDDHPVVLEGIRQIIEEYTSLHIVHQSTDSLTFWRQFKRAPTDFAILDIHIKGKTGLEIAAMIKQDFPSTKILIMTMFSQSNMIGKMIKAGADGFLDKSAGKNEIIDKIKQLILGEIPDWKSLASRYNTTTALSDREREIAMLLVEGIKPEDISIKLNLSILTVRTHIKNIYTKLQVNGLNEFMKRISDEPEILGI